MHEEFQVIPGYEGYSVSKGGIIKSIERDLVMSQHMLNGYRVVDSFRGSATETLPVHRAVALAWVENPDVNKFNIVNHIDGNPINNWHENLEWTNHSGNNYHAVNTGLRKDNIRCRVRDSITGEITDFSSLAQAAEFMGLRKDASRFILYPKKFGALISGRYEFKDEDDESPWFYETRKCIEPSRYMFEIEYPDGNKEEVFNPLLFLRKLQLHSSESFSAENLVNRAMQLYPGIKFNLRDAYAEHNRDIKRKTKLSKQMPILASCNGRPVVFESLTKCADYFGVDRSSIQNRLGNDKTLNGWIFTQMPS